MAIEHLYTAFQPNNYQLKIMVDRASKLISGQATITGHASQPTLQLHQKFMTVSEVLVNDQAVPFTVSDETETINFTTPTTGEITVAVTYTAPLTDTMMGIYPSYYELNGETKKIIGTQFETTFARQAFPSIDEPEAKATFDLALKFDEQPGETVLANMPETKVVDGYHYFERTVKMSTYLVAFAFGDLQSKLTETKSGVKVGVFATKAHQAKELDFALDIAKRAIEFYEDFYQTPYPLPHSWQLALPDFSAGAMENWGLVTYREAYLTLDPDNTPLRTKQIVATVITHELAHQWFGDLVTMKWWDELWLNESFANMMEYLALDALEPTWQVWDLFQTSEVPSALNRDATDGVQSVHVAVNDPAEIDALFDGAIVYAKGSRMLVMVRSLIGDDALRAGLKQYFAAHQYGNATGDDLWQALEAASGMPVGQIMHSWLEQPGYPVVEANLIDGDLVLSQHQFFIGEHSDQNRQWQIPLHANYPEIPALMTTPTLNLGNYEQMRSQHDQPLCLNQAAASHFIVKYDQTLQADLLNNLATLNAADQRNLLEDIRLLAQAQQIPYADIVKLLPQFAHSEAYIVNDVLFALAGQLKQFVQPNSDAERQLHQLYRELSRPHLHNLGWHANGTDTVDQTMLRPMAIGLALAGEDEGAIKQAHEFFELHQDDLENLPAAIRTSVLKNEMKHYPSTQLFHQFLTMYQKTANPSFKSGLQAALVNVKDHTLITGLLKEFKNAAVIKPQDLRGWYYGLLANDSASDEAWNWLVTNWDWLEATVGGDMEFATFITVTARAFKTPTQLANFDRFFTPKLDTPGLTREIKMDLNVIQSRVALIQAQQAAVLAALAEL